MKQLDTRLRKLEAWHAPGSARGISTLLRQARAAQDLDAPGEQRAWWDIAEEATGLQGLLREALAYKAALSPHTH